MRALALYFVISVAALQTATAESRIVVVGGTPENCKDELAPIRTTLTSLPIPDDWTFVVVCTSTAWHNILQRTDGLGKTHTAFTNLKAHHTYFNGSNFAPRVAAHELGHIFGNTEDHERAETTGLILTRQMSRTSPSKK
jgi:hypothetical protein